MTSMQKISVSFYKNISDINSSITIDINVFLERITSGKYKNEVEKIRQMSDKAEIKNLKSLLPNITTSGTFRTRADKDLLKHSGLIQIDFDKDKNPTMDPVAVRNRLSLDRYTFATFISPTGAGVKVIVRVDPNEHTAAYGKLEEYYKVEYGLNLDSSCRNVSRAMFVSYDPELYQNPDSEIFTVGHKAIEPVSNVNTGLPGDQKEKEVEQLISLIEARKIDITGDYKQWIKIGFGLASQFGPAGESYFHRISIYGATYKSEDCKKQYDECCKNRKSGIGINSLFHIAKDNGLILHETKQKSSQPTGRKKEESKEIIFYSPVYKSDDNGNQVLKETRINYVKFTELLYSFGFRRFDIEKSFIYIHLKDTVIKEVSILQIQDHFIRYLESLPDELSNGVTKKILKEKIYSNPKNFFCDNRLALLTNKEEISFNTDTKSECFIYYKNGFVKCHSDGWELYSYDKMKGHIWENQIIKRDFKHIDLAALPNEQLSPYAQFLKNVSGQDDDRFNSLCSLIGYLLHSYTDVKMKAIILTDSRVSDEANGRTGKTLFGQTLKYIKKLTQINGKDFDFTNRYKYQEASLDTQIIFLNDVRSNFKFETLYNDITEGITVEKKNQNPFTLKTKMCITTNKTIMIEGSSSKDRCIEFEFANHYNENYSPEDEFKQRFFSDWNIEAWQQFDNFMMHCICVYLGNGIIQPENKNLQERKLLDQTHSYFIEFMHDKINAGEIAAGIEICKQDLHEQFLAEYPELADDKFRRRLETFTKWIKTFARYSQLYDDHVPERKSGNKRYFTLASKK